MSVQSFKRLAKIYYSPRGYWKGFAVIKKLAEAKKVSEDVAQNWLVKQALCADLLTSAAVHSKT